MEELSDYLRNVDYPIDNNPLWKVLEDNYNKYYLNFSGDRTPKIPKKIHQIWIGSDLPIKYLRLIRAWIDKHPDWEYKLWTDRDVESFGMVNKKLFDTIDNKGLKSDIFRYEIIYRHGGMYLDTDFKCIKSFDDLLYLDFFSGSGFTAHPCAFTGLFATYAGNPLLLKIINALTPKIATPPRNYGEMMKMIGSDFFSEIIMEYITETQEKAVIFPKNYFYPFPSDLRDDYNIQKAWDLSKVNSYIKDVTYCVHLWFTSWQWQTQYIEEEEGMPPHLPFPPPPPPKKKAMTTDKGKVVLDSFLKKVGGR